MGFQVYDIKSLNSSIGCLTQCGSFSVFKKSYIFIPYLQDVLLALQVYLQKLNNTLNLELLNQNKQIPILWKMWLGPDNMENVARIRFYGKYGWEMTLS